MPAVATMSTLSRHAAAMGRNEPAGAEQALHRLLRRRGIAIRCRSAELADALQRFRDRQAEINAGSFQASIRMPPVAAGWMAAAA